jgi:hypothetical protein
MPGTPVEIGPWTGGLKNVAGFGEFINDDQAYLLQNFEVDTDGSLANRPSIRRANITGFGSTSADDLRVLGTWITKELRYLLVVATATGFVLIEPAIGAVVFSHDMGKPKAMVVYNEILYIVPTIAGQGGQVSVISALTYQWTSLATVPIGTTSAVYKDRWYIGQEKETRLVYSEVNEFQTWPAANNAGIGWENKQPLKAIAVVGSDLYCFKTDSTYRYGHAGDPARAEVRIMDNYVGAISNQCVAVYNNNTVYTMSGGAVYELYQSTYTRISDDLDMLRRSGDDTAYYPYGVSVFRDRLFVRFYSHMYVLNLKTQRWSEWTSLRNFSNVICMPGAVSPGSEIGYAASIEDTHGEKFLYYTQDSRIIGVADNPTNSNDKEGFICKLITKSFDFATPTYYKTILMGGLSVACSSTVTVSAIVPGSQIIDVLSWGEAFVQYTWGSAYDLGVTWGTNVTSDGDILMKTVIPPTDNAAFGRKLLKCLGKFRYRQVQFIIEIPAATNDKASFSVRLYNLTVYALQKQTVVKSVTP